LPVSSIHHEICPKGCNAECDPCLTQTGCITLDTFTHEGKLCSVYQEIELTRWIKPESRGNNCLKAHPVYTRSGLLKCCDGEFIGPINSENPGGYEFTDDLIYYLGDGGATYNEQTGKVDYTMADESILSVNFGSCVGGNPDGCCGNTTNRPDAKPLKKPKFSTTCRKTIRRGQKLTGHEPTCLSVIENCPTSAIGEIFLEGLEIGYRGSDYIIPNLQLEENREILNSNLLEWLEYARNTGFVSPKILLLKLETEGQYESNFYNTKYSAQEINDAAEFSTYRVVNTCDFYRGLVVKLVIAETDSESLKRHEQSNGMNVYYSSAARQQLRNKVLNYEAPELLWNNIYPTIFLAAEGVDCHFSTKDCKDAFCPPDCKTIETTTPDYG
jgi:hypothetical protein